MPVCASVYVSVHSYVCAHPCMPVCVPVCLGMHLCVFIYIQLCLLEEPGSNDNLLNLPSIQFLASKFSSSIKEPDSRTGTGRIQQALVHLVVPESKAVLRMDGAC